MSLFARIFKNIKHPNYFISSTGYEKFHLQEVTFKTMFQIYIQLLNVFKYHLDVEFIINSTHYT